MNTYWNGNGAEQKKYEELMQAVHNGWNWTKRTENIFHSYYRYFNDGDFPGWARGDWSLRVHDLWGWKLSQKGLEAQEQRITEAILAEYARLQKKHKN